MRSFIIEDNLYEDYFTGQSELFLMEPDTVYTNKLEEEHKMLFEKLINELTLKLFADSDEIEFDLKKTELEVMAEDEVFLNIIAREGSVTIRSDDEFFNPKLN